MLDHRCATMGLLLVAVVCVVSSFSLVNAMPVPSNGLVMADACQLNTSAGFSHRLPNTIVPLAYAINLQPQFDRATFNGTVEITVRVQGTPTNCIVISAASTMSLQGGYFTPLGAPSRALAGITYDSLNEWFVVQFIGGAVLPAGQGTLLLNFKGAINTASAYGFFQSAGDFTPGSLANARATHAPRVRGARRPSPWKGMSAVRTDLVHAKGDAAAPNMYATQFEPGYARSAFPCFDEPALKAYFQATFFVPTNYTVLFNTPQSQSSPHSSEGYVSPAGADVLKTVVFQRTPHVQTTYTVAFAMGAFEYIEQIYGPNKLPVRVYTPPGKKEWGRFALNVTIGALAYFESIYNFPFQMPKLDTIAVPAIIEDAMENWGLVTYDPNFLLVENPVPTPQTIDAMEIISQVVCHETAHHWHGNTLTCPWWDSMYMNEGFARWLQYTCGHAVIPEWDFFNAGGVSNYYSFVLRNARNLDAFGAAPVLATPEGEWPVAQATVDLMEVIHFFYPKGASINRQINNYVGETAWNRALAYHIATHAYSNPSVYDLADSFDMAASSDLPQCLNSHTILARAGDLGLGQKIITLLTQVGLPKVLLSYDSQRSLLTATQRASSLNFDSAADTLYWVTSNVSVQAITAQGSVTRFVLLDFTTRSVSVAVNFTGLAATSFVLRGNLNSSSYILVDYDDAMWPSVFADLPKISNVDQSVIIQNVFLLALSGNQPISLGLQANAQLLSLGLGAQLSWSLALKSWPLLSAVLLPLGAAIDWSSLSAQLYQLTAQMGGFIVPSPDPYASIRSAALFQCVYFGSDDECKDSALTAWNVYSKTLAAMPQALRQAAFYAAATFGTPADRTTLIAYAQSSLATGNTDALVALMGITDCSVSVGFANSIADSATPGGALAAYSALISRNAMCRTLAIQNFFARIIKLFNTFAAEDILPVFVPYLSTTAEISNARNVLGQPGLASKISFVQIAEASTRMLDNSDVLILNTPTKKVLA